MGSSSFQFPVTGRGDKQIQKALSNIRSTGKGFQETLQSMPLCRYSKTVETWSVPWLCNSVGGFVFPALCFCKVGERSNLFINKHKQIILNIIFVEKE